MEWHSLQLGNSAFGAIQKYPRVNLPDTMLRTYAWKGTAIMLIEFADQTQCMGQKAKGRLAKTATDSAKLAILEALRTQSTMLIGRYMMPLPEATIRIIQPTPRDEEPL